MSDEFPAATPDSAAAASAAAPSSSSSSDEQWKPSTRKSRPSRSYTSRSRARPPSPLHDRRSTRREKDDPSSSIITPLAQPPDSPSLIPRWSLRSMWELASLLNFLNVFRPLLKINVEFSMEELETALITPNSTLDDIHIPFLKYIDDLKSGNKNNNEQSECKYLINQPNSGLGNRMITLVSCFLYAILSNRVLLTQSGMDMSDIFCEPFPQSSWLLPLDFPHNHLHHLSFGNMDIFKEATNPDVDNACQNARVSANFQTFS